MARKALTDNQLWLLLATPESISYHVLADSLGVKHSIVHAPDGNSSDALRPVRCLLACEHSVATPGYATSSQRIEQVTVLLVGEASDDGLLPLIVAVPTKPACNQSIVNQIERNSIFTILYRSGSTPDPTQNC